MSYQDVFVEFWKLVEESVEEGSFAKLTMAKTAGKPELKNIFLRPVYSNDGFKVLLKYSYRSREAPDKESENTLDEALKVLKSHLREPFLTVLLFTLNKDITFKINKKGAGSIIEALPSFKEIPTTESDDDFE